MLNGHTEQDSKMKIVTDPKTNETFKWDTLVSKIDYQRILQAEETYQIEQFISESWLNKMEGESK